MSFPKRTIPVEELSKEIAMSIASTSQNLQVLKIGEAGGNTTPGQFYNLQYY